MSLSAVLVLGSVVVFQAAGQQHDSVPIRAETVLEVPQNKGPFLFLDDAIVAETSGITFTIHSPERYKGNPILVGDNPFTELDKATAPFTVAYDAQARTFRMWYTPHSRSGLGYHMGLGTSTDGLPHVLP